MLKQKVSSEYQVGLSALDEIIRSCCNLSRECAGIQVKTPQHMYASILFTTLCTKAVSLISLVPRNNWASMTIDHWDYSSIAVLTRSILEARLTFYYICIDVVSDEEWTFRQHLLNLHDCCSRTNLFELEDGLDIQSKLRDRLKANSFFNNLAENQQKMLLKGDKAYALNLGDIAVKAGIKIDDYKHTYKMLSAFVHTLPVTYFKMGTQERGRGVYSKIEDTYIALCMNITTHLLSSAWDEMYSLFRDIIERKQNLALRHFAGCGKKNLQAHTKHHPQSKRTGKRTSKKSRRK